MSALAIRIDYQYPQTEHSCTQVANDFKFSPIRMGTPPSHAEYAQHIKKMIRIGGHNLNPYSLREAFVAVSDAPSALRFLNEAGIFWPTESVLWSQFQEWQRFFYWLRQPYETAVRSPEGAKAWRTADGFENQFFATLPEPEPNRVSKYGPLWRFVLRPERPHGVSVSIKWHETEDKSFDPRPPVKEWKGKDQKPFLSIETHNIVEAIAATIYADRCHGLVYAVCKHKPCSKLFRVESQHGQEFCPAPKWLTSSPCKNAYQAQARRDKLKATKQARKAKPTSM
jgi:hypothetical protein